MRRILAALATLFVLLLLWGCAEPMSRDTEKIPETDDVTPPSSATETPLADVISVETTGTAGSYTFSVGVSSPDEGCSQYADWWEVLSEDGELLYRRILAHSHTGEQPFVRSGGPVAIEPEVVVWVRTHMQPGGYGGSAFRGSIQAGFLEDELAESFAEDVEDLSPLPDGCAF